MAALPVPIITVITNILAQRKAKEHSIREEDIMEMVKGLSAEEGGVIISDFSSLSAKTSVVVLQKLYRRWIHLFS